MEDVEARFQSAIESSMRKQQDSVRRQLSSRTLDHVQGRFLAAIEPSVQKQHESVHRQRQSAQPELSAFFSPARAVVAHLSLGGSNPSCIRIQPSQLSDYIQNVAGREGLAPELVRAVIRHESNYWPCAVSSKGALGLMQLMPRTASELGVRNAFDPQENIAAGTRYLRLLLQQFQGDVALALGAYNAGPSRVSQKHGLPPIPETENYVSAILKELRATPTQPQQQKR